MFLCRTNWPFSCSCSKLLVAAAVVVQKDVRVSKESRLHRNPYQFTRNNTENKSIFLDRFSVKDTNEVVVDKNADSPVKESVRKSCQLGFIWQIFHIMLLIWCSDAQPYKNDDSQRKKFRNGSNHYLSAASVRWRRPMIILSASNDETPIAFLQR